MSHRVHALINGEWIWEGISRERRNPARWDEVVATYPELSPVHLAAAVEAAQAAQPAWARLGARVRGDILRQVGSLVRQRADDLAALITLEQGKTHREAAAEADKAARVLDHVAAAGVRSGGHTFPQGQGGRIDLTLRCPLGVVALITPWNFPVAIPIGKLAPALAAGNTAVLKPASVTPCCAEAVAQLFVDAGIPPGVINVVTGRGSDVGAALATHPHIKAVSFTGSTATGEALHKAVAGRGVKVQCEMGGQNPLVVLDDADLPAAIAAVVRGAFAGAGQRCTATSRVIVTPGIADALVDGILDAMQAIRPGDGRHPSTTMGPLIDPGSLERVLGHISGAVAAGARVRAGGCRLTSGSLAAGLFLAPTLLDDVLPSMRVAQEELFGPVLSVLRVDNFAEAIAVANGTSYGLSAAVYTRNLTHALAFVEEVASGIVHVNATNQSGEVYMPFGGIKASGIGPRELGDASLDFYSEIKAVYLHS